MAGALDGYGRDVVVAARATDGRDFVKGIAGGWSTRRRCVARENAASTGDTWSRRVTVSLRWPTWDNS